MRIRREFVQASGMWSGDQPTCKAATGQTTFLLNGIQNRAAIQRRGSILAWIVILSVYGADTIAEAKLLISPFLR
jgi:hypothetical protein